MKSKLSLFKVVMLLLCSGAAFGQTGTSIAAADLAWDLDFETIDRNFSSPPNNYRMLNYQMNKDLENDVIDQLLDYGFGGVMSSVPHENYLQDAHGWDQLVEDVELAGKRDMYVWLSDETGYPSGAAGGLVVDEHPEFENRGIIRISQTGSGIVNATMQLPDDIEFFRATLSPVINGSPDFEQAAEVPVTGNEVITTGIAGEWRLSAFGVKVLDKNTQAQSTPQFGGTGHYPSLLNKQAMRRFIDITHQQYANKLGNIGDKVDVFYTNEPNLQSIYWKRGEARYAWLPWQTGLADEFRNMHGYDLVSHLDALFGGTSIASQMTRLHYFQTVGEVMARNFSAQITQWCHENDVQSSGHFLLEEYLACHVVSYGNFMQVMRNFDIPSCDLPIARPGNTDWKFWMPKFLSSAAYLDDKIGMVAALIDPIIGYGLGDLSPDIPYLRRTLNMGFLCGVNQITSYIPYREYTGSEHQEHTKLGDYVARIALMLRGAKNIAPIAMYYPIETIQSRFMATPRHWRDIIRDPDLSETQEVLERMAAGILQNGLDFNYVTADALLQATLRRDVLHIGDHSYRCIIMPGVDVISAEVMEKLKLFSDAGFPVYWAGSTPSLGTVSGDEVIIQRIASTFSVNNSPVSQLKDLRNSFGVEITSDDEHLFMSRFLRDGHIVYFVINDSEEDITVTARSAGAASVRIYDPVSGKIESAALPLTRKIGGFESLFFVDKIENQ